MDLAVRLPPRAFLHVRALKRDLMVRRRFSAVSNHEARGPFYAPLRRDEFGAALSASA
jgi:hypothetical protein